MQKDRPAFLLFLLANAVFIACLFFGGPAAQRDRAAYGLAPGASLGLRYASELTAGSGGLLGREYHSAAQARFTLKAGPAGPGDPDSAGASSGRGVLELALSADTVEFLGSERDTEEGRYMAGRLRKYRARLLLSRSGEVLALEEEPALPPVDFSTLGFGRRLLYALPVFPPEAVGVGREWTAEQPLLDKFNPQSKVVKRYRASSLRKTPQGRLLSAQIQMEVHLQDMGDALAESSGPALKGSGEAVFNLDKGLPVSVDLDFEGRFFPPGSPGVDSAAAPAKPLQLKERLVLDFEP